MTIDDQIKDEKLQYDINKEAAKISPLRPSKIDKYESLTGEEILPSNQRQIIEQAKFTYALLEKAFEKQTKAIKDQGEKRDKALKDLKPKEQTKAIEGKPDGKLSIQEVTYSRLSDERLDKIQKTNKEINFNNLIYHSKAPLVSPINFIKFKGSFDIFKKARDGNKTWKKAEEEQKRFKSDLNEITRGDPKHKLKDQVNTIKNVFIIQYKKLSIYLMIIQELDLKLFMIQNKKKQNREPQDLKY